MDFELSEEMAALQAPVRRLARDEVRPRAREIDRTGEHPSDLSVRVGDAGLVGSCLPEHLGGAGAGAARHARAAPGAGAARHARSGEGSHG